MKFISTIVSYLTASRSLRQNLRGLLKFFLFLAGLITLYAVLFHVIMEREDQHHSWVTGFYWTLVTMSTLGFGDITFHSDLGRLFSMLVLFSGMLSLLVLLPFTFIEFFYAPFIRAQSRARAPRELPPTTAHHVILTNYDPVTMALIGKLTTYGTPYVLLVNDLPRALELVDRDLHVVFGALDDPNTYRLARVERAALVAATDNDIVNTNIAFSVRELSATTPIVTTARSEESLEIHRLAGSDHVLQLGVMLGRALARRIIGGDARAHVIGRFDELLIAEATAAGTPLVGKTIVETNLRQLAGVTVIGVSERGAFAIPRPDTRLRETSVLVLAGSTDQIQTYDELFCIYHQTPGQVVILGAGRVGRAVAAALDQRGIEYRIVDRDPARLRDPAKAIQGSAAERETLEKAGLLEAPAVVITPRDDDLNIYLTIYCRRLRPDIQIISRATMEKNVATLHRAGADVVMSYASMGANAIFNFARHSDILMLAEGLNVFRAPVPAALVGRRLAETGLRQAMGCNVVAIRRPDKLEVNPDPQTSLPADGELILIAGAEGERGFLKRYGAKRH